MRDTAAAPGHVNAVRQFIFDALSDEQVESLGVVRGLIADRIQCGIPSVPEQINPTPAQGRS